MKTRINLEYILMKNKTDLSTFLIKNNIKTYDGLLAYCDSRNMNPVSKSAFDAVMSSSDKKVAKEKPANETSKQTKDAKTRSSGRSASKTPTKSRTRGRPKKVKSS